MKRYLITGSSGYIGSHMVAYLEKNFPDVIMDLYDNRQSPIGQKKVNIGFWWPDAESQHDYDAVIHFAASSNVDEFNTKPLDCFQNSIDILATVLKKARFKKFVFASSGSVYDWSDIESSFRPPPLKTGLGDNIYAYSKMVAEDLIKVFHRKTGKTCVILRLGNVAGQALGLKENHEPETHLIPKLVKHPPDQRFEIYGSGNQIRDYVHVLDVCSAFQLAANTDISGLFYYDVGALPLRIYDIISKLEEITGNYIKIKDGKNRKGDDGICVLNSNPIQKELGWKPAYSIEDVLKSYIT